MSHRRLALVALAAYTLGLVVVLLNPSDAAGSSAVERTVELLTRIGAPDAVAAPHRVEFALNVAIFAPWALLASLVWPRPTWRDWTAYGFVATALVETAQAVLYSGRAATFSDVAANTLGALLGAVAVSLWRAARPARDEAG